MSLYYLILWNQVDILQKHFKKDHAQMRLWDEVLRYGWCLLSTVQSVEWGLQGMLLWGLTLSLPKACICVVSQLNLQALALVGLTRSYKRLKVTLKYQTPWNFESENAGIMRSFI